MATSSAISYLRRQGIIERFDIPGSRAKGTRLLQPHKSATELPIDDAALRDKRLRDDAKLETMIRFANSPMCRQSFILRYFGETEATACGRCDRCQQNKNAQATMRDLNEPQATIVRKALSGVARASKRRGKHEWEPRFGRGKITRMLAGSEAADMIETGLINQSTFGILKELRPEFIKDLFAEMERAGLVGATSEPKFPKFKLTVYGSQIMLGEEPPPMRWPETGSVSSSKSSRKKTPAEADFDVADQELYEQLRQQRMKIAKARERPPFTIFSNATLMELVTVKPTTTEEAIDISGVGPYKAKTVLPPFLEIIRAAAE